MTSPGRSVVRQREPTCALRPAVMCCHPRVTTSAIKPLPDTSAQPRLSRRLLLYKPSAVNLPNQTPDRPFVFFTKIVTTKVAPINPSATVTRSPHLKTNRSLPRRIAIFVSLRRVEFGAVAGDEFREYRRWPNKFLVQVGSRRLAAPQQGRQGLRLQPRHRWRWPTKAA